MRIPGFLRSRWRLLCTLAAGLLLPLAALTYLVGTESRQALRAEARRQSERAALLAARAIDNRFQGLRQLAESYARRPLLAQLVARRDDAAVRQHLAELVRETDTIDRAFISDASGVEWHDFPHVPEVIGQDFSHRDWYRGVSATGDTYVSEVYQRTAPPRHHLVAIATPIRDAEGALVGYLVVQHTVHDLAAWLASLLPEQTGRIRLFGRTGRLAMADAPGQAPPELTDSALSLAKRAKRVGSVEERDPLSRDRSLISHSPVSSLGGFVLVSRSLSQVLAPARSLERWIYGLSTVAAIAMVVLGFTWLNTVRRQHLAVVELGAQKDQLTGMLVHDLRNPLTGALSYVALLEQDASRPAREDLDQVRRSLLRIQGLVNNLLDVIKLEEGTMVLKRERVDVAELLSRAVEAHEASAQLDDVELALDPSGPVEADVDPHVTTRIVENLIVNALKHTFSGGRITVSLTGEDGEARIVVSDTGEGIPAEAIPHLFRKFGRVSGQRGARSQDTGFGLLFCRMATEAQGGRIWVNSEAGRGSDFVVALPRA